MTTIVGYKYKEHFILAADSQVTEQYYASNSNYDKIDVICDGRYVISACGDTSHVKLITEFLEQDLATIPGKTNVRSIICEVSDRDTIINAYMMEGKHKSNLTDILTQEIELVTLGSGGPVFLAAYTTLVETRGLPKNIEEVDEILKIAFKVTSQIDLYTNNSIRSMHFKHNTLKHNTISKVYGE